MYMYIYMYIFPKTTFPGEKSWIMVLKVGEINKQSTSHKWSTKGPKQKFSEIVQESLETARIPSGNPGNLFLCSDNPRYINTKYIKSMGRVSSRTHGPGSGQGAGPGLSTMLLES